MKRCYTSYVIREVKTKTTLRYCNIPIWMVKIQNIDNLLCWWGWRLTGALIYHWFSSVQFIHSVVSDSLWPHEAHHARPPCPSPTPGVHPNPCPLSRWCHPTISSSVVPFSSCPQSLPASESFPMSQRFTWGGQSTGVSALASFLPKNTQGWPPSEWTGWISLQSTDGLSEKQTHNSKARPWPHSHSLHS